MSTIARTPCTKARAHRLLLLGTALLWTVLLLTGCGGGEPEPEPVETPRVDCTRNPEACK